MVDQNKLLLAFHRWYYKLHNLFVDKSPDPLRFGVLGAAAFAPIGLSDPAKSHPDVMVVAVAARSLAKAQAHTKVNCIARAYGSYDELVAQDDIDAVYVPLPVTLHGEWAIKAMRAGKHDLLLLRAGTQTKFPLPTGVIRMDNGCCGQSDFVERKQVAPKALVPSVFQHIGNETLHEADLPQDIKHGMSLAQRVWNFRVEVQS